MLGASVCDCGKFWNSEYLVSDLQKRSSPNMVLPLGFSLNRHTTLLCEIVSVSLQQRSELVSSCISLSTEI